MNGYISHLRYLFYIYIYIYVYIYVYTYYLAIKENKTMPFGKTWMTLIGYYPEQNKTEKYKYSISLPCGIYKTNEQT